MKRFAVLAATAALTSLSAAAPVTAGLPAGVREAARAAVLTSSVEVAAAAFRRLDWRGVRDPRAELAGLEDALRGRGADPALIREVRTKIALLTPGVEAFRGTAPDVPVTEGRAPGVPAASPGVLPVSVGSVNVLPVPVRVFDPLGLPVIGVGGIGLDLADVRVVPVTVFEPEGFGPFRRSYARWFRREFAVREATYADGNLAVGQWGSRVWLLKRQLRKVEDDEEYLDAAREYSRAAGTAAWRRDALKRKP